MRLLPKPSVSMRRTSSSPSHGSNESRSAPARSRRSEPSSSGWARRALVATGKTLGASPLLERVTAAMGPHCAGVFAGVGQHVPASSARALVAEAERVGADALVAFGGGSPIDACKVAAASLFNRRDMTLVAGECDFDGASRAGGAGREIRLVAVPTTLSAGEFTPGGGVTAEATRVKRRVSDARLHHRTVIYDP